MVARLDGPTPDLAKSLVDRAITAEMTGLWACVHRPARYQIRSL